MQFLKPLLCHGCIFGSIIFAPFSAIGYSWDVRSPAVLPSEEVDKPVVTSAMESAAVFEHKGPYAPQSHNVSLNLGQIFLLGAVSDFSDSLGYRLTYTHGVSEMFSFESSIGYSSHVGDTKKYSKSSFLLVDLTTGVRLNALWYDKLLSFSSLGAGFFVPTVRAPSPTLEGSSVSISGLMFGVYASAGVDLEISKSVFFGASLSFYHPFGATKTDSNGQQFFLNGTHLAFLTSIGISF